MTRKSDDAPASLELSGPLEAAHCLAAGGIRSPSVQALTGFEPFSAGFDLQLGGHTPKSRRALPEFQADWRCHRAKRTRTAGLESLSRAPNFSRTRPVRLSRPRHVPNSPNALRCGSLARGLWPDIADTRISRKTATIFYGQCHTRHSRISWTQSFQAALRF